MIYTFEGFDGCGKDSVADAVARQVGMIRMNFPNDESTYTGSLIRRYLKRGWHVALGSPEEDDAVPDDHLGAMCLQSLMVANRMEQMDTLQLHAKRPDIHLALGRYWQSGWVYGQLDGLSPFWLQSVHRGMVPADVCFLVDASPETCLARRQARDGTLPPERYEGKLEVAREAVRLYRQLWGYAMKPGSSVIHSDALWVVLDAEQPLEAVVNQALEVVRGTY